MACVIILAALIGFLLLVFWFREFILLMAMPDKVFPGRYDKVLWFVLFVVAGIVAPFAFYLTRLAMRSAARLATIEAVEAERRARERHAVEPADDAGPDY
jgi:hypothetical protein